MGLRWCFATNFTVSTINVTRVDPFGGASLPTVWCRRLTLVESTPSVVLRYQLRVSTINVTRVDPYGGASLPTSQCRRLTLQESTPSVVLRYQPSGVDDQVGKGVDTLGGLPPPQ